MVLVRILTSKSGFEDQVSNTLYILKSFFVTVTVTIIIKLITYMTHHIPYTMATLARF
jgi:hypothetical protein